MADEIAERGGGPRAAEIVLVGIQAETDGAELPRDQGLMHRLHHPHGDVGVAAQKIVDGIGQNQLELQVRVLSPKPGQKLR
jgi:hypothetical protein